MDFEVNSFQIPNALVDNLMRDISPNALKCYLIIVRKTKGWNKEWDKVSTKQLMEIAGIKKKNTIYGATKELIEYGLIEAVKQLGNMTSYKVVPKIGTSTENGYQVVPKKGTSSSTENGYTTKDTIKNTLTKTTLSPKSSLKSKREEREDIKKSFLDFVDSLRKNYKGNSINNFYPILTLYFDQEIKVANNGYLYFSNTSDYLTSQQAVEVWRYLYKNPLAIIPLAKSNQGVAS
ncbi:MAG: replication protein [Sulfurovaceae bacterium]|nr:replication protein [Sulfurovaceae bacterium]